MPYVNKGLSTKICPFIEDVTGSIITINNQFNDHLLSLKATIEATQQGSGDPSPDNVRPIVGVSEVNITQQVTDTPERIYTINLGGTYYGGVLDVTNGVLTVTKIGKLIKDLNLSYSSSNSYFYDTTSDKAYGVSNIISEVLQNTDVSVGNMPNYSIKGGGINRVIYIKATDYTDVANLKNAIGDYKVMYDLAEESQFDIQLTPTQVDLAIRQNTIFADTGNLEAIYKTYTPT